MSDFERIQAVVRPEIKNRFEDIFIESGANSKGDFITKLLDSYTTPIKQIDVPVEVEKVVEKVIVVEKPIEIAENQILVTLTPIQKRLLLAAIDIRAIGQPYDHIRDEYPEEGHGDSVFKDHNYYAVSPSFIEKFGRLMSPLKQEEPDLNMGRILINVFTYNIYKGGDLVPEITRSELRKIAAEEKKKEEAKQRLIQEFKEIPNEVLAEKIKQLPKETKKEFFQKVFNIKKSDQKGPENIAEKDFEKILENSNQENE